MNSQSYLAAISPAKLPNSEAEPSLPLESIRRLAKLWSGSGALADWISVSDWDVEIAWSPEKVRARVAELILFTFDVSSTRHLPKQPGDWLDLINQQLDRTVRRLELPTAHTDWPATSSEFGRYPTPLYVERSPVSSYDTPFTRTLKWTASTALRTERIVIAQFNRMPWSFEVQQKLIAALKLPEIDSAQYGARPDENDLQICRSVGGVWLPIANLARQLSSLWFGNPIDQLRILAPLLPELGHQLFELSVLGKVIDRVRERFAFGWRTSNPLGAAKSGKSCLDVTSEHFSFRAFYQTAPKDRIQNGTIYRFLASSIGGSSLRPDIWLEFETPDGKFELIIECKFSLDASYVASGVPQSMAYSMEYPTNGPKRIHAVVGPNEVVKHACATGGTFALLNSEHLGQLVDAIIGGDADTLISAWS
jgi:hypothetical protein